MDLALYQLTATVCDSPAVVAPFDAQAYMGLWYEQFHVKDEYFQKNSWTCNTAVYSDLSAEGDFNVSNTGETASQALNKRFGVSGAGSCPDPTVAACYVAFFGHGTDYPNYNVIDTDYTSYSVVYTCDAGKAFLWLMAREPNAEQELLDSMWATARTALPNFDFTTMLDQDYQGEKCQYPVV